MAPIPFPLGSHPGRRTHESAGRLINAYAEPLGPGAVGAAKIVSSAGLLQFTAAQTNDEPPVPLTGYRGAILVGSTLYAAFENTLVFVDETGAVTKVPGSLPGTDRVQFSRNNKQPVPDVVATIPSSSYLCSTSAITAFTPPGMSEITNVFMDGFERELLPLHHFERHRVRCHAAGHVGGDQYLHGRLHVLCRRIRHDPGVTDQ
jgi:hypothetical protein